jgi:hypothetical protein
VQDKQQKKLVLMQKWSTTSSGMDVHIWRCSPIYYSRGFEDIMSNLAYGATLNRAEDRI